MEEKYDPRYVFFAAELNFINQKGVLKTKYLPMNKCTERDLEKFYPEDESANTVHK